MLGKTKQKEEEKEKKKRGARGQSGMRVNRRYHPKDAEVCRVVQNFVKVSGRGLNLEVAAAILKPSCSQATGP